MYVEKGLEVGTVGDSLATIKQLFFEEKKVNDEVLPRVVKIKFVLVVWR